MILPCEALGISVEIIRKQTRAVRRFGGERKTPVDFRSELWAY